MNLILIELINKFSDFPDTISYVDTLYDYSDDLKYSSEIEDFINKNKYRSVLDFEITFETKRLWIMLL